MINSAKIDVITGIFHNRTGSRAAGLPLYIPPADKHINEEMIHAYSINKCTPSQERCTQHLMLL